MNFFLRAFVAPVVVAIGHASAAVEVHVQELLGRDYRSQLLGVSVTATEKEALPEGCALLDSGQGTTASQIIAEEFWPQTTLLKRGRAVGILTVPASSRQVYRVLPASASSCAGDLAVSAEDGVGEMRTKAFAIRVPLGEGAGNLPPAPIKALRDAQGRWSIAGGWFGGEKPVLWSGAFLRRGPLVGQWEGRWKYGDGTGLRVRIELAAGDSRALVEAEVTGENPSNGWLVDLSSVSGLSLPVKAEWGNNPWGQREQRGNDNFFPEVAVSLSEQGPGLITSLVPWADWWDGRTQTSWRFNASDGAPVLTVEAFDGGSWIEPEKIGRWLPWGNAAQRSKWLSLEKRRDGRIAFHVSNARGVRKMLVGSGAPALARDLQEILSMTLDWPMDGKFRHPLLFTSGAELREARLSRAMPADKVEGLLRQSLAAPINYSKGGANALGPALRAYLISGSAETAKRGRLAELANDLGRAATDGDFDYMRSSSLLVNLYDAIASESVVTPDELQVLRARVARLGYRLANAETWSPERGFASGNLDMSMSFAVSLALVAAVLPDHPMSRQWWEVGTARVKHWLNQAGPKGEWPENSHYTSVSMSALMPLVLAASRRGEESLVRDEHLRRVMVNLGWQHVPPDPRYGGYRTLAGYGKGTAGERFAIAGIYAKAIRAFDPSLSAQMQWLWQQSGRSLHVGNRTIIGFEDILTNAQLASAAPDWGSIKTEDFMVFRGNFAGPGEDYAFFLNSPSSQVSPREAGSLVAWYAQGKPLSLMFGNGEHSPWTREARLQNRVMAARNWEASADGASKGSRIVHDRVTVRGTGGAVLPVQDYGYFTGEIVAGESGSKSAPSTLPDWPASPRTASGAILWARKLLFMKSSANKGSHYFVIRDSVSGAQPTEWALWTMTQGLVHEPGGETTQGMSPGQLPHRDLYTRLGQYSVDVDIFVASPGNSPRHAMQWGFRQVPGFNAVAEGLGETQELFHLRLDGDGTYFVVAYPRARGSRRPTFASLGKGRIVRIDSTEGTDWVSLGDGAEVARAQDVSFSTAAGSIRKTDSTLTLSLSEKGEVVYRSTALAADIPASLTIDANCPWRVEFENGHGAGWISVTVEGKNLGRKAVASETRRMSARGCLT